MSDVVLKGYKNIANLNEFYVKKKKWIWSTCSESWMKQCT